MSSTSSVGRVPLFLAGRASEVLRKFRKLVLPEDRVPMMRILLKGGLGQPVTSYLILFLYHLSQGGENLLERRRVLPPTDAARAVDGAHGTTGIAVAATMGHALGARVGVDEAVGGDRGDGDVARGGRGAGLHGAALAVATAGDDGDGIRALLGIGQLGRRQAVVQIGQLGRGFGDGGGAPLPLELLVSRVLLLAELGTKVAGFGAA